MFKRQDRFLRNDEFASEQIDGTVWLCDRLSGNFQRLNAVGSFIWCELAGSGHNFEELLAALIETFDVEPDQARNDLQAFLAALIADCALMQKDFDQE
jgi:hypothetical protein